MIMFFISLGNVTTDHAFKEVKLAIGELMCSFLGSLTS